MTFRTIKLVSDTGYEVEIGENSNVYVLDQDGLDLGSVNSTHNMTQYIDLVGKHLDSTVLSPRDISIIGWIIGKDEFEINKRKRLLNKLVNPNYKVRLEIGDYALEFYPDSSIQYSKEWDYNNEWMCKFQIQGTAPMPLFTLKDYNTYSQTVTLKGGIHFPLVIPKNTGIVLGYYPLESLSKMANTGDVESGFTLYLSAEGGDVTNFRLTNLTTGQKIQFNTTIQNGQNVEICTEIGNQYAKLISKDAEINIMKYLSEDSDIDMTLALWVNKMELFAETGKDFLQVKLKFSPRFLEVEGR